jgi:hypothetical protein
LTGIVGATVAQAATITYDAAEDFSITANPNGVWSYGLRDGSTAGSFTTFNSGETMPAPATGVYRWDNDGASDPSICYNPTATNYTITEWGGWNCDAGELIVNPAGATRIGVRWTAPTDGQFAISAAFAPSQDANGANNAYVHAGGSSGDATLWQSTGTVTSAQSYSSGAIALAAGDTIDFVIDAVGAKTTSLSAQVTAVPEPSAIALLTVGLGGLLAYGWHRQK